VTTICSPRTSLDFKPCSRDPNSRFSYLEVQLQGLRAENTRLSRELRGIVNLISKSASLSEILRVGDCSIANELSITPSRRNTANNDREHGISSSEPGSGSGLSDSENAKSKRLLRRIIEADVTSTTEQSQVNPGAYVEVAAMKDMIDHVHRSRDGPNFDLVTRAELHESIAGVSNTLLDKIRELENRVDTSVGPVERIISSSFSATPSRSQPKAGDEERIDQKIIQVLTNRISDLEKEMVVLKATCSQKLASALYAKESAERHTSEKYDFDADSAAVDVDLRSSTRNGNTTSNSDREVSQQSSYGHSPGHSDVTMLPISRNLAGYSSIHVQPHSVTTTNSSVNLSRALGSFLEVVHKCTGANEKTKDILTSLDHNLQCHSDRFGSMIREPMDNNARYNVAASNSNFFDANSSHSCNGSIYSNRSRSSSPQNRSVSSSSRADVNIGQRQHLKHVSPLSNREDVLSSRQSSKGFSFPHTPTMRGGSPNSGDGRGNHVLSTGVRSPANDTWKDTFTPAADPISLANRTGLISSSSSPPYGSRLPRTHHRQPDESADIKVFVKYTMISFGDNTSVPVGLF
jgi:hypothetical protein